MDEVAQGSNPVENQDNVSPPSVDSSQPASTEKLLRQSEVNEIVGNAKQQAVERYKRQNEGITHVPQKQQQQVLDNDYLEVLRKIASEETAKAMESKQEAMYRSYQEEDAKRIATEFFGKLQNGKERYEDFDQVLNDVDLQTIPAVVTLANNMDNTADVMYELGKNPAKIASIYKLLELSPKLAYSEMKRISDQIKQNDNAKSTSLPKEPLSQLRSSNQGLNTAALSVSDYRKKYRV